MIHTLSKANIYLISIIGLMLFAPINSHCEVSKDEIPQIIKNGLEAYKLKGPEAAISEWIKGSPFEGSKDAMSQANIFKQVEAFYGKYVDYYPIGNIDITPSISYYYLAINYEFGPVFAKFLVYKTKNGWILTGKFNFNTEPEQILPKVFLDIKNKET